jgi:DNA-binding response OmpR family regulator
MNVLIIEDEQKIADILVQGLQASGFQANHEADGFRGLNTALIKNFDAIVMDVSMPLMDGFQVLAEIRRKGIRTPVIMLTARTELADRLQGFESGADDYLAKPFFVSNVWFIGRIDRSC